MEVLSLVQYAAEAAIAGIILWFVVELLPMPGYMKRVTQSLIALVLVLGVLKALQGPVHADTYRIPLIPPGPPAICKNC